MAEHKIITLSSRRERQDNLATISIRGRFDRQSTTIRELMHSEDGFILLKPSIQIPINDHLMKITIFMAVSALSLSGCDLSL